MYAVCTVSAVSASRLATKKQDKLRRLAMASGHLEVNVAPNTSRL